MAVVGAAIGVGIVLVVHALGSASPAGTPAARRPSYQVPARSGIGALPGGGTGPGGSGGMEMMLVGKVLAVSSGSITIGGPGHSVTAVVTSSTKVTGNVSSIAGIKVGAEVSAQLTQRNGKTVAAAVQDPAAAPAGGPPP
jgi:hypothetical protein